MAIEIERKFLVRTDGWRARAVGSQRLRQGYLAAGGAGVTVRVRTLDDSRAVLTVKAGGSALARSEFEYDIPIEDARQMLRFSRGAQIEKTRHTLDLPGGEWVVDVFEGQNKGLVLAEVELEDPVAPLDLPTWLGDEVTGNPQYYNSTLAMLVGGEI